MTIERKNTSIFDTTDDKSAEGTSEKKPNVKDIEALLKAENWLVYDVDVWFDSMQGFWRWDCNIIRP